MVSKNGKDRIAMKAGTAGALFIQAHASAGSIL